MNQPTVQHIVLGSYESSFGLPDGEVAKYFCAWDADSAARLYDTESTDEREANRLVREHYPDALVVSTITMIEKGARI